MSYISGNIGTFQQRLHSTPTGLFELSGVSSGYWNEGQLYANIASSGLKSTWNKEYELKWYQITHSGITGMHF